MAYSKANYAATDLKKSVSVPKDVIASSFIYRKSFLSSVVRVNHWNADDAGKYDLESAIVNTINVFEEATSLLKRKLINRHLIYLSLGKDFSFAYRVIAKMVSRYSQDGMMDFENFEIERLNKEFVKIFGEVKDRNLIIDRKHISKYTEDITDDATPVNQ